MGAARAAKRRSIRALNKDRQSRRGHYDLVVGRADLASLNADLERARARLEARKDLPIKADLKADLIAESQAEVDAALAAVDAHRERLWFQAISKADRDALKAEYAKDDEPIIGSLFLSHLLAACAEDSDDTGEDWHEVLASWPESDQYDVATFILNLNREPAAGDLPKA